MSLFFDKRLPSPASAGPRIYHDLKWHRTQPLLAFSVYDDRKGGLVAIYDHMKDGTSDVDTNPRPGIQVTSISWHPFETWLAIGYESGEVLVWNQAESESFEGSKNHVGSILILEWSPCGTFIVSADSLGSLLIWGSNSQGHLQARATHDFKEAVCQMVFRRRLNEDENKKDSTDRSLGMMTTWRPKTAGRRDLGSRQARDGDGYSEVGFFVGLLTGAIFYLKADGSSDEVLTSGSSVKCLLCHQTQDILVVMTDAAILGQFQIDPNGGLCETNKVKLSGQGHVLSWAGVGILAIISEDLSVRLWDVDSGENFVLEPGGSNSYSSDECFISIDVNAKTGHLCCNTNKGKLVVWREIRSKDAVGTDDEDRWEWCATFPVSSGTKVGRWCQNVPDLLAINAVRDIFVLRQQDVSASYYEKVSIMQTLATQLSIHMYEEKVNFELEAELQIKGFSNTKSHLSIWSGSQVETYEIGSHILRNYKLCGSFADKSEIVHMFEQSLFMLESLQIQVRSFLGVLKQTLTFLGSEGPPITLSGAGEYITSASANGFLKIWHVGQREAKLHAPAKNMRESVRSLGEIIHAKNNQEGTRIAFTVAKTNLLPDSRFFVWEISADSVTSVKFPGQFVSKIYWEPDDSLYTAVELKVIPSDLQEIEEDFEEDPVHTTSTSIPIGPPQTTNPWLLEKAKRIMEARALKNRKKQGKGSVSSVPPEANPAPALAPVPKPADAAGLATSRTPTVYKKPTRSQLMQANARAGPTGDQPASDPLESSRALLGRKPTQSKPKARVIEQTRGPYLSTAKVPEVGGGRPGTSLGPPGSAYPEPRSEANPMAQNFRRNRLRKGKDSVPSTPPAVPSNTKRLRDSLRTQAEGEGTARAVTTSTKRHRERRLLKPANETDRTADRLLTESIDEEPANQIRTLFICAQKGILTHEKVLLEQGILTLLGLDVPHWYFLSKSGTETLANGKYSKLESSRSKTSLSVQRRFINDFQGVDEYSADDKHKSEIKKALLSYVYHNVSGDVDRALKAMKNIRNPDIWKNMARLCVKSKRVDVAGLCFARMGSAASARALKLCEGQPLDAQVAMLALQLDMIEDAESLYRESGEHELWLKVLRVSEKWEEAIELCEKHCRIQLRTTYYAYAKYLEKNGRIDQAIRMYELSGNHRYEVTRMLLNDPDKLERYVLEKKEKDLYKWWAQYLESTNEMDSSLAYYEMAEDWLSLTRLLCYCDDIEKAVLVAESVKDKASCYHIAGQLLGKGDFEKAVKFYTKAQAYGPAMRICKENEMDDNLWRLSLMSDPHDQLEAARYFETREPPDYEKAIHLYHKSGYGSKAMDIAISTEHYSALQEVARDLIAASASGDHKPDPEILKRCAEFFVTHQQYDKALDMFATAKSYGEAMDVCVQYKIPITEEMAERLTPPRGGDVDLQERSRLLEKMGECCMLQGNYHLSAKKFTEAGNKVEAMRVLVKSGDTDRIIYYANVARSRDIFMLAANYLQIGTDWQNNPKLQDQIVNFYIRAKSPESIITFYESWAQTNFEVDRNYELSLDNLGKAMTCLQELIQDNPGVRSYELRIPQLQVKIDNVVHYLGLRELYKSNPSEGIEQLRAFVRLPDLERSVSRGEIYGLLVEYYVSRNDNQAAMEVLKEMKVNVLIQPARFIKSEVLQTLNDQIVVGSLDDPSSGAESSRTRGGRRGSLQYPQFDLPSRSSRHEDEEEVEEVEEVIEYVEVDEDEEVEEVEEDEDSDVNQHQAHTSFNYASQPTFRIN